LVSVVTVDASVSVVITVMTVRTVPPEVLAVWDPSLAPAATWDSSDNTRTKRRDPDQAWVDPDNSSLDNPDPLDPVDPPDLPDPLVYPDSLDSVVSLERLDNPDLLDNVDPPETPDPLERPESLVVMESVETQAFPVPPEAVVYPVCPVCPEPKDTVDSVEHLDLRESVVPLVPVDPLVRPVPLDLLDLWD